MKTKLESDTGSNPPACSPSSDTPETDAVEFEVIDDYECGINVVSSCLARKLERERDELLAAIRAYRDAKGRYHTQMACERLLTFLPENDRAVTPAIEQDHGK